MADTDFSRFVPGFDFLQGLMKNAGAAIPGFNQWVAPTLDPQELDKRIDELRTVQFWLENNARMLSATIQALEVQRMTLSTLHAMNVPMGDLQEALKTKVPAAAPPAASAPAPAPKPAPEPSPERSPEPPAAEAKPVGADPMQWWNALTQQFAQVASNAVKTAQTTAAAAASAATGAESMAPSKPAARPSAKPAAKPATKNAAKTTRKPSAKKTPARKTPAARKTS